MTYWFFFNGYRSKCSIILFPFFILICLFNLLLSLPSLFLSSLVRSLSVVNLFIPSLSNLVVWCSLDFDCFILSMWLSSWPIVIPLKKTFLSRALQYYFVVNNICVGQFYGPFSNGLLVYFHANPYCLNYFSLISKFLYWIEQILLYL